MKVVLTSLSLAISLSLAGYAFAASPRSEPVSPILPAQEIHIGKAELGKKLYSDPRLSKSGFISCNSCHNLSMGGSDNLKTSIGHNWQTRSNQLTDCAQFQFEYRPILGWSSGRSERAGGWADCQSG